MNDYGQLVENASVSSFIDECTASAPPDIVDALLTGKYHPLARYWADPAQVLYDAKLPPGKRWAGGPTEYQIKILRSRATRLLVIMGRQIGKTESDIAWCIWTMLCEAPAKVLVLAPSHNQTKRFVRRFRQRFQRGFSHLARILNPPSSTEIRLDNGSTLIALPHSEATIVGHDDVALLVIDEAARVSDELFNAVLPMTDKNDGRVLASSTALFRVGWFWRAYQDSTFGVRDVESGENRELSEGWDVHQANVWDCPWTDRAKMEQRRREMPARVFEQNYECGFQDAESGVFREVDIAAMFHRGVELAPRLF